MCQCMSLLYLDFWIYGVDDGGDGDACGGDGVMMIQNDDLSFSFWMYHQCCHQRCLCLNFSIFWKYDDGCDDEDGLIDDSETWSCVVSSFCAYYHPFALESYSHHDYESVWSDSLGQVTTRC